MHCLRRFLKPGQSLVEFALIAPLLLGLLFIIVELGVVFSVYIGLTNSAREAARAGVAYQYPNPEAFKNVPFATARQTVDTERTAAMDGALMATLNPLFGITNPDQLNPLAARYTYDPANGSNIYRYGDNLTVTLTYRHELFFRVLPAPAINITGQSKMRLEPGGL